MAPSSAPIAAVEAVGVALLALGFGRLLVDAVIGKREVDALTRWALAFPALAAFAFLLMMVHIATGGAVFSNAGLIRVVTLVLAALLLLWNRLRRIRGHPAMPRYQRWVVVGACILGVLIWGYPVARLLPLNFGPDTNLHMGWATQLMIGETTPSTVVTGHVPGSYPWLYHALIAYLARFTPGGTAFHALGPLQILQVAAMVLAFFALGMRMTGRFFTGAAAAFFGALSGGFGVGMLFNPHLRHEAVHLPATRIPWLGDVLSRRPYNFAFNNIAPAYPRDVSFTLLVAFLLLFLIGLGRRSYASLVASGVVLGLVGLSGGEAVIVGFIVAALVSLVQGEMPRFRTLAVVLLPALAVWGTWLFPLIYNYVKYGGFVNITHVTPVVLTFPYLLLSWAIALPFAVVGLLASLRRWRTPAALTAIAIVAVTAAIMGSNVFPEAFGGGFFTLGRDHRYWCLCELGVTLFAALGATVVWGPLHRYRWLAAPIAGGLLALGVVSPALGSTLYLRRVPALRLVKASLEGHETLLNALAAPQRRCVVAVRDNLLAREVFSYTGYRLVQWVNVPGDPNDARIRWRSIYRYIPGDAERATDNRILTTGQGPPEKWQALTRKYGVNYVVVPRSLASSPILDGYPKRSFDLPTTAVTLVQVKPC